MAREAAQALTAEEAQLLRMFRELNPRRQERILRTAERALNSQRTPLKKKVEELRQFGFSEWEVQEWLSNYEEDTAEAHA